MKKSPYVSYVVSIPSLNLGGCRLGLARGSKIEIDRDAGVIRHQGQEYKSPTDVAILLREREVPMIVADSKSNCDKFTPIPEKKTKTTKVPMEIIECDEDVTRVINLPKEAAKKDLGKPSPINKDPLVVEPQSVVREIPIKKAKAI